MEITAKMDIRIKAAVIAGLSLIFGFACFAHASTQTITLTPTSTFQTWRSNMALISPAPCTVATTTGMNQLNPVWYTGYPETMHNMYLKQLVNQTGINTVMLTEPSGDIENNSDWWTAYNVTDQWCGSTQVVGATNASPIVITLGGTSGLRYNDTPVVITGLGGNTAANSVWYADTAAPYSSSSPALYSDIGLTQSSTGNGTYSATGTLQFGWKGAVYEPVSPGTSTDPTTLCSDHTLVNCPTT